jgi:glycosyltransferase involved in cell wall biosynthesis
VEDLDDLYRKTRVVCVPILSGSGTRVKILEAAAYGKPVVSTSIGAEGLEMNNKIEILIHNDPQGFAAACISLLNDNERCGRIGDAGRSLVKKNYEKEKVKQLIKKTIQRAL